MGAPDTRAIHAELERVRADLRGLVRNATTAELRLRTAGTRWTNQQMLFHMVFGYMVVLRLLPLVHTFGRLPEAYSRAFAATLNAAARPFHAVNYLGSCGGALVFHGPRLTRQLDRTLDRLHQRLAAETAASMARHMHFPVRWDPFFDDSMTPPEVYHYATVHYAFHRAQLTLGAATPPPQ
ncbi:conserved hypothetical protein [Beutenbergia cavernae DSM 12333]|uniref:DinB-like domain-containing protein n=1 Tax=Beutenbergia cavernae (strain ATCC BAA-8 / DSM 12333 / CCUG 43141 / JCM 11478 / NBRC 16432 / NCIMB 13614 / HKI 0122) TaxID=471853 RepID=C5BYS1_BEUC1|nr:DinB family protein [Beutenbergia cavernae]ACQ79029.1 conserved hypothetical protein [Beutenbergia cavernae DSM 12333]